MQRESNSRFKHTLTELFRHEMTPIIVILIVFVVVLSNLTNKFFTVDNILNVLRQISIMFIAASGMTMVLLAGGVDISIGSILGTCAVFSSAALMHWGFPVPAAILFGIAVGGVLGLVNGLLIVKTGVQPIIVTLATMSIYRSFPYLYTSGQPIVKLPDSFKYMGQGYVGPVPFPVILMLICFVIVYIVVSKTRYGMRLYAIGSNENTARLSGIRVIFHKLSTYVILGLLTGLAGVMMVARIGAGVPSTGDGFEFNVLTAALIGGVSLNGGRGSLLGTLVGCLIMGVLGNGLNLLNVSSYFQMLIMGSMLIIAVTLDAVAKKRRA